MDIIIRNLKKQPHRVLEVSIGESLASNVIWYTGQKSSISEVFSTTEKCPVSTSFKANGDDTVSIDATTLLFSFSSSSVKMI